MIRHRIVLLGPFLAVLAAVALAIWIDLNVGGVSTARVTSTRDLPQEEVSAAVEEAGYRIAAPVQQLPLAGGQPSGCGCGCS